MPLSPAELGRAGMPGPQLSVRPLECPSQVGKVKAYRRKDWGRRGAPLSSPD